jgi:hypothetical protein
MIEPLRVELELDCTPDHAFRTWTQRLSTWWPRGHSVSGAPAAVVLEPRIGGRIYEETDTGEQIDWGWITTWEPPERLGYRWHIRRPSEEATEVEVRFTPGPQGRTRLVIEQCGWEALGADAERWRDANRSGWAGLLPHFVTACDTTEGDTT